MRKPFLLLIIIILSLSYIRGSEIALFKNKQPDDKHRVDLKFQNDTIIKLINEIKILNDSIVKLNNETQTSEKEYDKLTTILLVIAFVVILILFIILIISFNKSTQKELDNY